MLEDISSNERSFDIELDKRRGKTSFLASYLFFLCIGSGRRSRVNNEEPKQQGKPSSVANNNNNNNGNGKAKSIEK